MGSTLADVRTAQEIREAADRDPAVAAALDLVEAVARGVDLFDCVAPTRNGRQGTAFTSDGKLNVRRAELRADPRPLDETCECSTCARFSRAYIRHLFTSDEVLGLLGLYHSTDRIWPDEEVGLGPVDGRHGQADRQRG